MEGTRARCIVEGRLKEQPSGPNARPEQRLYVFIIWMKSGSFGSREPFSIVWTRSTRASRRTSGETWGDVQRPLFRSVASSSSRRVVEPNAASQMGRHGRNTGTVSMAVQSLEFSDCAF